MTDFVFPKSIREAIVSALPEQSSQHGNTLELGQVYLPASHAKALDPDVMVVEGMRGAGKSVWQASLQNEEHRRWLGKAESIKIDDKTIVSEGFQEKQIGVSNFPTKDVLISLQKNIESRLIWKTVVFKQVVDEKAPQEFRGLKKWLERVKWVQSHPEEVDELFHLRDQVLHKEKRHHLVLFDALDRTADDWKTMNVLVRGLLQVVLDMRSYKRIRLKVFVRPDQIADPAVRDFPDSSKLLNATQRLDWSQRDLYGLLWRYLANSDASGDSFRKGCAKIVPKARWGSAFFGTYDVPSLLNQDEDAQRDVFHAITGPWMGRDQRRGFPYSWLPSHLCDVHGKVSPRSFLAAFRHAASDDTRTEHDFAIHFESIKQGVQAASRIRVEELVEDFPWMEDLFRPLKGITVPCGFETIEQVWNDNKVIASLKLKSMRMAPQRLSMGATGVLQDLLDLGFVEQLKDKRINLPDVYRVGYGLGRKGGVKPLKIRV